MRKIPVIIDCDPGVDDSYAIALANAHPDTEVVAITAVEGNMPARVTRRNCLFLAETFGMEDTVIGFGAERPLIRPYCRDGVVTHGAGGIGNIVAEDIRRQPDERPAWDIIWQEAVKRGGELVLIALGPLTNIALALRKYPRLPEYIRRLIVMGGGTFGNVGETGNRAEFNIWVDPTAAREVFEKMEVWLVGLDATHAAALSKADFEEMLAIIRSGSGRASAFLNSLTAFSIENSFGCGQDNNVIHDALAVASLMDPDVVRFETCRVRVEERELPNVGETLIFPADADGKQPLCHVGMSADRQKFMKLLTDMCRWYV